MHVFIMQCVSVSFFNIYFLSFELNHQYFLGNFLIKFICSFFFFLLFNVSLRYLTLPQHGWHLKLYLHLSHLILFLKMRTSVKKWKNLIFQLLHSCLTPIFTFSYLETKWTLEKTTNVYITVNNKCGLFEPFFLTSLFFFQSEERKINPQVSLYLLSQVSSTANTGHDQSASLMYQSFFISFLKGSVCISFIL